MEILGVGPLEVMFILIIALIIMGPQDMVKTGKTIGRFLRRLIMSPTWNTVQQTSRELKYLPNKLIREAGLEEDIKEIEKIGKEVEQTVTTKPAFTDDLDKVTGEINQSLSAWTKPPISEEDLKILTSPPPPSKPKTNSWITPPVSKQKDGTQQPNDEDNQGDELPSDKTESQDVQTSSEIHQTSEEMVLPEGQTARPGESSIIDETPEAIDHPSGLSIPQQLPMINLLSMFLPHK